MFKKLKIKIKIGAKFCHLVTQKKREASNCTQTMFFWEMFPQTRHISMGKKKRKS